MRATNPSDARAPDSARSVMPRTWFETTVAMAIFGAWATQAWRTRTTYLAEVAEKCKAKLGKLAESIWTMKKAELVDQVVERCGLTRSAAEAETVGQLRLMLKEARDGKREASGEAALPKLFARMRKEEL